MKSWSCFLVLLIGLLSFPLYFVIGDDSSEKQCTRGPIFYGKVYDKKSSKSDSPDSNSSECYTGTSTDQVYEDPNKCHDDDTTQCDPDYPYRTFNGTCNNLEYPLWGRANECYLRIRPAFYDGFEGERKSSKGGPLPRPRDITLGIFNNVQKPAPKVTFMFSIYGQTLAHDVSQAPQVQAPNPCCDPKHQNDEECISIKLRPDDPFFSKFNVTCSPLNRTQACDSCNSENREQINLSTASLDASIVYGVDDDRARSLRTLDGTGKMIINSTEIGDILPTNNNDAFDVFCSTEQLSESKCFYSGDQRVNQHTTLSGMQTLFVREHNRIATILKTLNPHWDDERLYQESRRINIAELQSITYREYLPVLLGTYLMQKFDLIVPDGPVGSKYNSNIRLSTWNEFAAAIFRLHSMVASKVGVPHQRFRDYYINPDLIRDGNMGSILKGVCKVPSAMYDNRYTEDTIDYLYQGPNAKFGSDLSSTDMKRGRDHGLAPYVYMVNLCSEGSLNITSFDDLAPRLMSKKKAKLLKENYASVEDVDLSTGVQLEHHFPGSLVGHTAACILAKQFRVLKFADRFFYGHEGEVPSFSAEQRETLKLSRLSRYMCDNLNIETIQKNVMRLSSNKNPRVSCDELPKVDLSLWKE